MLLALLPRGAAATYSIAATDSATGQVGGAGTSCVGSFSVSIIYGAAPGRGVVHAQSYVNVAGRDLAVARLEAGVAPLDILAELTGAAFDPDSALRQYGVVDLAGRAAGFTGAANGAYAGDRRGTFGSFTYAAQGNILTSAAVIDQASTAFEAGGCDLADRLMRALEAGALGGEGDSRCTPRGIPSDGAFLEVDRPGEPRGGYLAISVDDTSPTSPLVLLRTEYDRWRADHPCPVVQVDAGPADRGVDPGDANDADATPEEWVDAGDAGEREVGTPAEDSGAGWPDAAGSPGLDGRRPADDGGGAPSISGDASCRAVPAGPLGLTALLALGLLWLRRLAR